MIRNTLIALYILAVLAISAVSRAEVPVIVFEPKRPVKPVIFNPPIVDPLPGCGNGFPKTKLSIGTSGVRY